MNSLPCFTGSRLSLELSAIAKPQENENDDPMQCSRVRYALKKLPGRLLCARVDARMGPLPGWSVRATLVN